MDGTKTPKFGSEDVGHAHGAAQGEGQDGEDNSGTGVADVGIFCVGHDNSSFFSKNVNDKIINCFCHLKTRLGEP